VWSEEEEGALVALGLEEKHLVLGRDGRGLRLGLARDCISSHFR
jgi:hypothetical protein